MIRVFISSTSRDLKDHRAAVLTALQKGDLSPIAMEFFGTQPGDPTSVSFDELHKADLFVGIYAHRYGYSPDGDRSITEMEFTEAKAKALPQLIFIVRDDYHEGLLGEHAETDEDSKFMLNRLKKRLRNEFVQEIEGFTTPEDLALKVASGVLRWIQTTRPDAATEGTSSPGQTITNIHADEASRIITGGSFSGGTFNFGDTYHTPQPKRDDDNE